MSILIKSLTRMGLLKDDLDYHLIRASIVILYFVFGYQKCLITKHKASFRSLPTGLSSSGYVLGASEWLFGALLLARFWNKKLGVPGALGSVVTFYVQSRSSRSCRTTGLHRQADSPRWSEMWPS